MQQLRLLLSLLPPAFCRRELKPPGFSQGPTLYATGLEVKGLEGSVFMGLRIDRQKASGPIARSARAS